MFDITALTRRLAQPQGAHDVLAEACVLAQQLTGAQQRQQLQHLQQLQHCLGRHLPILKTPPADMRKTLVQLASQEPAGSRLLQQAHAALHSLQYEVIEWVNKPRAPLPCVMEIREHSEAVYAVTVSPDGKWIASGSGDKTVKVVEIATGRVKCTLTGHSGWIVFFFKFFFSGFSLPVSVDCVLTSYNFRVYSVACSSDGKQIASGSSDKTIKIWDSLSGDCQSTLTGHRCVTPPLSLPPLLSHPLL